VPLHVRLAAPEPEFIDVTFGFRVLRTQIHDFLALTFDEAQSLTPKKSGRRFTNVPCMVRKIVYDLEAMTVTMHLWSLGNTSFEGNTVQGVAIGGEGDKILLSTVGAKARSVQPVRSLRRAPTMSTSRR
jgi:hypothetical protein